VTVMLVRIMAAVCMRSLMLWLSLRHQMHLALRTASRMVLADFRVHGTHVERAVFRCRVAVTRVIHTHPFRVLV